MGTELRLSYDLCTFSAQVYRSAPLYIGFISSVTNITYTEATVPSESTTTIHAAERASGAAFVVLTKCDRNTILIKDQLYEYETLAGPAEVLLSRE